MPGFYMLVRLSLKKIIVQEWVCILLLGVLYSTVKVPFLSYNGPINVDESQMLTQAITLSHDPVFWRSVDGTTSGPLNSYLIWLFGCLGFAFNYYLVHGLAVALVLLTIWITYRTLILLVLRSAAILSTLILYCFLITTSFGDFNHFNSELPSVVLLGVVLFLIVKVNMSSQPSYRLYFVLGVVGCLVPFAKLQGGALAFGGLLFAFLHLLFHTIPKKQKIYSLISLIGGSLLVLLVVFALLVYFKIAEETYVMYIVANLSYIRKSNFDKDFYNLFLRISKDYFYFLLVSGSLWLISGISQFKNQKLSIPQNLFYNFLFFNLLISLWVVTKSGYHFGHYLFYTFIPITLLNAYSIQQLIKAEHQKFRLSVTTQMVVIAIGYLGIYGYKLGRPDQSFRFPAVPGRDLNVASIIRQYTKPSDCLMVWGWNSWYYIETGLWQATRQNDSVRCMNLSKTIGSVRDRSLLKWYRSQFMDYLTKNRPAVIVDEARVNSLFYDTANLDIETFPALKSFIDRHYQLVQEVEGIFVFVRKDRL
jgi:hypothetical protein